MIQIPPKMSLSAALSYFSNQLPQKESGWIELFGTASKVQKSAGHFIRGDETLNISNCVCLLVGTKLTTSATISELNGQHLYSGPIHDFNSESIDGRISMLSQTAWVPPAESPASQNHQNTKDTMSLDPNAVSWDDLAQLSKQGTSEPGPSRETKVVTKKTAVAEKTVVSLAVGDVMMHPRFGRCKIVRAPSFGKVKIRKPSGAFADLHLKIIQIVRVETSNTGRVFHVQIGPVS